MFTALMPLAIAFQEIEEDDDFDVNEGTILWVLLVILLILACIYIFQRLR